jgi:hypothetical protein
VLAYLLEAGFVRQPAHATAPVAPSTVAAN